MKIIVRTLALGMLLTGFAADHYLAAKTTLSANSVDVTATSSWPNGSCNPNTFCAK